MGNSSNYIVISAKNGDKMTVISLRKDELIANLRILVAVRFECPIDTVVLIYAGHVLIDVGTIASQGITTGVTVYVVFRQPCKIPTPLDSNVDVPAAVTEPKPKKKKGLSALIKPLLEDPSTMRQLLESTPYMKAWLDDNPGMRYFIKSESNLRDIFTTMMSPAKRQEVRRLHDVHIMRLENLPGYSSMLNRAGACVRETYEMNVAKKYQTAGRSDNVSGDSQRGCENKSALPNPWQAEMENWNLKKILKELTETCRGLLQKTILPSETQKTQHRRDLIKMTMKLRRHLNMHMIEARQLNLIPVNSDDPYEALYTAPPADGLSLIDFMSTNKERWEEQFRTQLDQLRGLGHLDCHRNICALLMSWGDVQTAVEQLNKWNQ